MEEGKDALTLKWTSWDRTPKFGGRIEESVRKKGKKRDFNVPQSALPAYVLIGETAPPSGWSWQYTFMVASNFLLTLHKQSEVFVQKGWISSQVI